jgi:Ca-activated chloride channel homolog
VASGGISLNIKTHRGALSPNTSNQKIFAAVRCTAPFSLGVGPSQATSTVLILDTSGSMNGPAGSGTQSKMDVLRASLLELVQSVALQSNDQIGIVTFDLDAHVMRHLAPVGTSDTLRSEVATLDTGEGSTYLASAIAAARTMLEGVAGIRRVLLITDGEVFDADACRIEFGWFGQNGVPITAIGVGSDWKEQFLSEITDRTGGKPYQVITDLVATTPISVPINQIGTTLAGEWRRARLEAAQDLRLHIKIPGIVAFNAAHTVFPVVSRIEIEDGEVRCNNLMSGESTVVLIELTCPSLGEGNVRVMQVSASSADGEGGRMMTEPQDVIVEVTADATKVYSIDQEVQNWLQQRNMAGLLQKAADDSAPPDERRAALVQAQGIATRVVNVDLGKTIQIALGDLDRSKTVRVDVAKALHIGGKTHTINFSDSGSLTPELEELIRNATGA